MSKILLLEDDLTIGQHLRSALTESGFEVNWLSSSEDFIDLFIQKEKFDSFILDRLVDRIDSKDFIPKIKRLWPQATILIVSAINTSNERTELIDYGADDYIGKPFSTQEVIARVKALNRRVGGSVNRYLQVGDLIIDLYSRSVSSKGTNIIIPAKEFLLIQTLAQEPGRVWNKEVLLDKVWGSAPDVATNVVESTMTNLRKKLLDLGSSVKILNLRNSGYWIEG